MWELKDIIININILNIFDILIVAVCTYKLYKMIKGSRAEQLVKGIFVLIIITKLSEILQLHMVNFLLKNAMTVGIIAILIMFQPELRKILEYLGKTKFLTDFVLFDISDSEKFKNSKEAIEDIERALHSMAKDKIGALLIIEGETGLKEIVQTGVNIDAKISRQILENIFTPNRPLHDGAMIIKDNRIKSAGCFLPLSDNFDLNKDFGTRHRAGLGVSEVSDCTSFIVSEETGSISVAKKGKLHYNLSEEEIKKYLLDAFKKETKTILIKNILKWGGVKDEKSIKK